jgi:outer membrane protein TolC
MSAVPSSISVLLAATLAAMTCGCAVGPRWRAPLAPADAGYAPVPLPETSASAPVHGGEAQRLIAGRDIPFEWWELFQSPALNALIAKAFKANPTVTAARASLRQAQELV